MQHRQYRINSERADAPVIISPSGRYRKRGILLELTVSANQQIHVSAAVITDSDGRILLVRKRNTHFFMQPGGANLMQAKRLNRLLFGN